MSEPLKDFRGKITRETDVALQAEARLSGRDRADIAREILHSWAAKKLHEASVLADLALAQGISGSARDTRGGRK